jgi:hypothetical protein
MFINNLSSMKDAQLIIWSNIYRNNKLINLMYTIHSK